MKLRLVALSRFVLFLFAFYIGPFARRKLCVCVYARGHNPHDRTTSRLYANHGAWYYKMFARKVFYLCMIFALANVLLVDSRLTKFDNVKPKSGTAEVRKLELSKRCGCRF